MKLLPDWLRALVTASDVETVRIVDAFEADFNARIDPKTGDLYKFEIEMLGMYNDVRDIFVGKFNETKDACIEPQKLRINLKSIGAYFDNDFYCDGKNGMYHKGGVEKHFESFGLGLGYMIGILEHNFEQIFASSERYVQLLEMLKKYHPFFFEYFKKQAAITIEKMEYKISFRDPRRNKLEILKGLLASCGAL